MRKLTLIALLLLALGTAWTQDGAAVYKSKCAAEKLGATGLLGRSLAQRLWGRRPFTISEGCVEF